MKAVRCAILPVSFSLMAGLIGFDTLAHAQIQTTPAGASKLVNVSGPKKPVHKLNEVPTTDSVVLLGVRPAAARSEKSAAAERPAETTPSVPAGSEMTAEATEKKAAEIASLGKQIHAC